MSVVAFSHAIFRATTICLIILSAGGAAYGQTEFVFKGYGSDLAYSRDVAFSMARTVAKNEAHRLAEAAGYRVVRYEDGVFYTGMRKQKHFCEGWVHAYAVPRKNQQKNYPNVERDSNGKLSPKPGYKWIQPNVSNDYRVYWKSGLNHPSIKGIYSGSKQNHWSLKKNYHWMYPGTNKLDAYYYDPADAIMLPPAITMEDVQAGSPKNLGTIYTRSRVARIFCADHSSEDGDRVQILKNGYVVHSNVLLKNRAYSYNVSLSPGRNRITFKALNEGSSSPNTAEFFVRGEDWKLLSQSKEWSLKANQSAEIIVVRQ